MLTGKDFGKIARGLQIMNKTKLGFLFISISLFFFAAIIFVVAKDQYSNMDRVIPADSTLASIPIAGISVDEAVNRVKTVYLSPIYLQYGEQTIQVDPVDVGFTVNEDSLRIELDKSIDEIYSDNHFIASLFREQTFVPINIDLQYTFDTASARNYLESEIVPRYDLPAIGKQPAATGGIGFYPGHSGSALNIDAAVPLIETAAISMNNRTVILPLETIEEPEGNLHNLEIQLMNVIDQYQDDGQVTEMVLIDPVRAEKIHLTRRNQEDLIPDISFTAASTMKIPIMISSYVRMDEEPTPVTAEMLRLMITESKNDQTDWMMENVIGGNLAPYTVTEDMRKLGLENTFLAGYFYLGAPLLDFIETPANSRTDIDLNPDSYNQTTPDDMAELVLYLYQCDEHDSGKLREVFGDSITQHECTEMIDLLKKNYLPYLISDGVPENTVVAHKHGWIEEADGLLHTMSNVGIVYSPGQDYILSIYTWHPENLIFEDGNSLFRQISAAVYGYFNPSLSVEDLAGE